jgi:hypothetical protein
VRGHLDHFGATYTIRRISGNGVVTNYELTMSGPSRAIGNLTRTLKDGKLGY